MDAAIDAAEQPPPALLDVRAVSALLNCSPRHVYRLSDSGRMPRPVKLGALVRWRVAEINAFIAGDWKPVRIHATRRGVPPAQENGGPA